MYSHKSRESVKIKVLKKNLLVEGRIRSRSKNYGSGSGTLLLAVKIGAIPGTLFICFYFPYETYINTIFILGVELRLLGISVVEP
jgi:hypothetical protein